MVVVVEAFLIAGRLGARLVCLRERVRRRISALVLLLLLLLLRWWWRCLGLMLLVNDARGSRVQMLGRRRTLLLVLRMVLHREKTH